MNKHIRTVIFAPMTSTIKNYPTRITTTFQDEKGQIVLEQICTVHKSRLIKNLERISSTAEEKVFDHIAREVCHVDLHTQPAALHRSTTDKRMGQGFWSFRAFASLPLTVTQLNAVVNEPFQGRV